MSITMRIEADAVELVDPSGDLRRAGQLDINAVPIVESADGMGMEWTHKSAAVSFRICRRFRRLYRREVDELNYPMSSCRILYIRLSNERMMKEWLA